MSACADAEIEVRDLSFDLSQVQKRWHGGKSSITTFFDNLSVFFPAGERFFIAAVRRKAKRITDTQLSEEVRRFCGQEGIHRREHQAYNEHLERQGYPVRDLEARVERLLEFATRRLPPSSRLAVTCALEHFTALMGHSLLDDERTLAGADETMAALWRWHAVEENEHKSVAFDVYVASGGTYSNRVIMMAIASVIFWAKVVEHQARMAAADGKAWSPGEWISLFDFLFVNPGGLRPLIRHYLAYYRRDFHPRDIDSVGLIDAWRRSLRDGRRGTTEALDLENPNAPVPEDTSPQQRRRSHPATA